MSYIAQRKNRIIQIAVEKADEYAKMGYQVTDRYGDVVAEPVDTSLEGAKETIAKLKAESAEKDRIIKELNVEIDLRDKEIAKLKAESAEKETSTKATTKKSVAPKGD